MQKSLRHQVLLLSALLLLLGLLSSVGVAVGDAIVEKPRLARWDPLGWTTSKEYSWQRWNVTEFRGAASRAVCRSRPSGREEVLSPMVEETPWWCPDLDPRTDRSCDFAHGWPLPALRVSWPQPENLFVSAEEALDAGIIVERVRLPWIHEVPPGAGGTHYYNPTLASVALRHRSAVPLRPVLAGLLVDSLVHAGVWAGLIVVMSLPFAIRRRLRRRRDACVSCAYLMPSAASARCPECGWDQSERWPCPSRAHFSGAIGLITVACAVLVGLTILISVRAVRPDPIFIAAAEGDVDRVRELLAAGVAPDCRTPSIRGLAPWPEDSTPLMWAAAHNQLAVMEVLLAAGANINAGDSRTSVLDAAVRYGSLETLQFMLEHAAILDRDKAIRDAAHYGTTDVLACLLDLDQKPPNEEVVSRAIADAAAAGRMDNLRYLLSRTAGFDAVSMQSALQAALQWAVKCREPETARLLLESGPPLQYMDQSALWKAAARSDVELVQLLLDYGADANCALKSLYEPTPLWAAVKCSNDPVVRLLLRAGADPQFTDDGGRSLLFAVNWYTATDELVELLLNKDLDVDHRDAHGITALMVQSFSADERGVQRLLAFGADALIKDDLQRSALDLVITARSLDKQASKYFDPAPYDAVEKLLMEAISSRHR